jgi:dihydrofolate synthase / folylpolyglutamate synthase
MNYDQALDFIHGRHSFKKHPNLEIMKILLAQLGNPQNQINAIHVAGTNGKGSTVAFLRNIFQANHYTVGSFTSPFIKRFNERISVDGISISDNDLIQLVETIKPIVEHLDVKYPEEGPTEFELITAMMFFYFVKHPVDVVIVEVGIGGLLDSTNVVPSMVSVITTIGMDHMQILGDTISKIAVQKAGIIKHSQPVIVGAVPIDAFRVIAKQTDKMGSRMYALNHEIKVQNKRWSKGWQESFTYTDDKLSLKQLNIHLLGEYQINNASCAIKAYIEYQVIKNQPINLHAIKQGLDYTRWAGRFELLNNEPLVVIDGAHNIDAMRELGALIERHFNTIDIYIVVAILSDKDYLPMLNILGKIPNVHLTLTEFHAYGKRKSVNMRNVLPKINAMNTVHFKPQWQEAITYNTTLMSMDDMLLITGSLYFISDVRKLFVAK